MTPNVQPSGSLLEERVAEKYKRQGFQVVIAPKEQQLPFDLNGYPPDLIATKSPEENYIIEVKSSASKMPIDRYREVSELVAQHPGWSFILVTDDDISSDNDTADSQLLLTFEQIIERQKQAKRLLDLNEAEAAFLLSWGAFEAMLRRQAILVHIPIERFPTPSLIKHLYSQGELSMQHFDEATQLQKIRNRFVVIKQQIYMNPRSNSTSW
jgi:REase_AHJR-like